MIATISQQQAATELVSNYLENPEKISNQISKTQSILKTFKTNESSSALAANALNKYL